MTDTTDKGPRPPWTIRTDEGRTLFRNIADRVGDPFGDKQWLVDSIARIEAEAAAPDAGLREALRHALKYANRIYEQREWSESDLLEIIHAADDDLAAHRSSDSSPAPHVKHDDWWCECGSRIEDCDYLQEKLGAAPAGPAVDAHE